MTKFMIQSPSGQVLARECLDVLRQGSQKVARAGVVGDLALDRYVFGSVDRISPEAPVPVLCQSRIEDRAGCAANVFWNLLGYHQWLPNFRIDLWGVVGFDPEGAKLKELLTAPGANLNFFQDPSRPTSLKTRYIAGDHHQLLRLDRESRMALSKESMALLQGSISSALPDLKVLIVQDYAKGLWRPPFSRWLLEQARQAGVLVIIDPNRNTAAEEYFGAHLITPNVAEAESLLRKDLEGGASDDLAADACRELRDRLQLKAVLMTRSRFGMSLLDDHDEVTHFPAQARQVFDVTGAGDTVVAMLGAAVSVGLPLKQATMLANSAASVVVAKVGTARAQVSEIIEEIRSING